MKVSFKVRREIPGQAAPSYQTYQLEVERGTTVLDALNRIKWEQDGTLAFRKNCRNAICGSCTMRINGRAALACACHVEDETARGEVLVQPMGNMPVIKDLVVDMSSFWKHLDQIDPYISTAARNIPAREFLQTPEQRAKLEQAGNCILCGACYSECNSREVNPNFVGPHALAKAYRMVADNRDERTSERLQQYNEPGYAWSCTRCFYCNEVCPTGVQPLDQIQKIRQALLAKEDLPINTAIRHRKALIKQIKESGWLDEVKFALEVFGHTPRGLLGLLPLGIRMTLKGKTPLGHQPIENRAEVTHLVDAVNKTEHANHI
ncbi:MAG: succinate dehydrogenase/fumarate reductase iron-sulfur subunit [Gemmatimonadaceae bacterium]|nr:succinate dehydrogenase/fumarate reductase iron-sulfur subunit [Gloeobacterales cyanobacterium ES-bin-141]